MHQRLWLLVPPMNKREAKREACRFLAAFIDGGIIRGSYVDLEGSWSEADQKRVRDALEELIDEMVRRAGGERCTS